ncbi:hypothetical protein [Nannocystis sp. SCPEA4]|uniref:hypothetical protein n=1 Tax=Nannocystis sp. SCPEA4 TaxID=2996787 RepID=UPI002271F168|nr:hypothetical protein [Nannocystis sp. SCPEA4]MCY1060175.1 hypothetical protein [Nannocystis sp. SCPEA4]
MLVSVACSSGEPAQTEGAGGTGSATGSTGDTSSSSGESPLDSTTGGEGDEAGTSLDTSSGGPEPSACEPPSGDGVLADAIGFANPARQEFTAAAVGPYEVLTVLVDVEMTPGCESDEPLPLGFGEGLEMETLHLPQEDGRNIAVLQYDLSQPYSERPLVASMIGGVGHQRPAGVAVDADGTVYIAGVFNGNPVLPANLGETVGYALSGPAIDAPVDEVHSFVVAYSATGEYLWHVQLGGAEDSGVRLEAIAVDPQGGLAIAGAAHGEVSYEIGHACEFDSSWSPFVARYPGGPIPPLGPTWVRCPDSSEEARALAVDIDEWGHVVATGYFREELTWRDEQGEELPDGVVKAAGDQDLFVARWDEAGNLQWQERCGSAPVQSSIDQDAGRAVLAGADGRTFIAGEIGDAGSCLQETAPVYSYHSTALLAARDPSGWAWERVVQLDPQAPNTGAVLTALAQDGSGQIVTAGSARGALAVAETLRGPRGETDGIVAKFACDGELAWLHRFGSDASTGSLLRQVGFHAVAIDEHDAVHLAGAYWDSFHPKLPLPVNCGVSEADSMRIKLSP